MTALEIKITAQIIAYFQCLVRFGSFFAYALGQ